MKIPKITCLLVISYNLVYADKPSSLHSPDQEVDNICSVHGCIEFMVFNEESGKFTSIDGAKDVSTKSERLIMEFVRTDEDVWLPSVTDVWIYNDQNAELIKSVKENLDNRATCTISNTPKGAVYASFFKFGKEGLMDWVVVYEVVIKDEVECLWLKDGYWLCLFFDGAGNTVGDGKLFHHSKKPSESNYANMATCSAKMTDNAKKVKEINKFLDNKFGPVFKDDFDR